MTILHLAHRDDWDAALASGSYRISTTGLSLDEVGFIHASYPNQVAGVAQRFYADDDAELCVLVLDVDEIRASGTEVVDEDAGNGEFYPHIYGPITPDVVTQVLPAGFDEAGVFRCDLAL